MMWLDMFGACYLTKASIGIKNNNQLDLWYDIETGFSISCWNRAYNQFLGLSDSFHINFMSHIIANPAFNVVSELERVWWTRLVTVEQLTGMLYVSPDYLFYPIH